MKERRKWARLTRVLGREGEDARTSVYIYLEVFQYVMLYGLEMWIMTPRIGRLLGGFHNRVSCRMVGRQPQRVRGEGWVYLPLEDVMAEAGLQNVETYVSRLHDTVVQYIATRPIMELCLVEKRRTGPRVTKR